MDSIGGERRAEALEFLEMGQEDVGALSCEARSPEKVSSICAVLAETDVINMVSRGIATSDILKGIHLSMSGRYVKLLRAIGAEGDVLITGGLAADRGLGQALQEAVAEEGLPMTIRVHEHSIYAGALGAALWGAFRHRVLAARTPAEAPPTEVPAESP